MIPLLVLAAGGSAGWLTLPARRHAPRTARLPALAVPSLVATRRSRLLTAASAGALAAPLGAVVALAAVLLVVAVLRSAADLVAARARMRTRTGWDAALGALAAAYRAAVPTPAALRRAAAAAAGSGPVQVARPLTAAAAAVEMGADPAEALAAQCGDSGDGARLAAALRLCADLGAAPSALLTRIADLTAAELATARAAALAVASARATVGVLAGLPVLGLALAAAYGASALQTLLHRPLGHGCLLLGAVFEAAGLSWTRRLLAGVTS